MAKAMALIWLDNEQVVRKKENDLTEQKIVIAMTL